MRTKRLISEFSMTRMGADFQAGQFAEFASRADNQAMRMQAQKAAQYRSEPGLRNAISNVGKEIGNKANATGSAVVTGAVNAKNKVAVLVKKANGKAFIQQRWKNVQDAGKAVGGAARQAGGAINANRGKSAAIAGAVGLAGGGIYALSGRKD